MGAVDPASPKVSFLNLGCRVNRVELDEIAASLEAMGCEVVPSADADLVVINTCAVTGEAEAKARKAVRRSLSLPQAPWVIATGCVASLFESEVSSLGERVIVEPMKARVADVAREALGISPTMPRSIQSRAGTPTGRSRPGIKVQDGCDNRCSYCIVWKARGAARSLDVADVIRRVREEVASGSREVVLTGINLGRYESVANGRPIGLTSLLDMLMDRTEVARIRLSSIEPQDIDHDLLRLMGDSGGRVAPFLHVPLQSGCDHTLREMNRGYTCAEYSEAIGLARELVPGIAVGCDLIVGFPGETDADFSRSLSFCEGIAFSKMHVFRYSRRPGTPAAERSDQVPAEVSARRSAEMRELARRMRLSVAASRVGHDEVVLVQSRGKGVSGGLFDVLVGEGEPGELVRVRVHGLDGDVLDAR